VPVQLDGERWGFLPEQVRVAFLAHRTSDFPVRYRDYIDAYYRRLSRAR